MRTFILALLALSPGCATLAGGGKTDVLIAAQDAAGTDIAVDVYYKDVKIGSTPFQHHFQSASKRTLLAKAEGFHDREFILWHKNNAMVLGNVLFGGVVGLGIDMVSGATADYPEGVILDMVGASEEQPERGTARPITDMQRDGEEPAKDVAAKRSRRSLRRIGH